MRLWRGEEARRRHVKSPAEYAAELRRYRKDRSAGRVTQAELREHARSVWVAALDGGWLDALSAEIKKLNP